MGLSHSSGKRPDISQTAKRGSAGKQTACLISDCREVYGYYKDGESASSADQVANHWDRDKAGENASCEQICQIFRPKGLPSRY
ncbi:MAG: hypothetical protein HP491_13595 [Nitrospira sp.]|nr:hypothetical protein [Nitrospira sp.]MBH0181185.1 hypothetical protein [Nitrospira sp.]MBH0184904.1 hypothetical protein [Nitrospira sp.]